MVAAHSPTIAGVGTKAVHFHPAAFYIQSQVHPGLYQRRPGMVDPSSLQSPGFGMRVEAIVRSLPERVRS